MTLERNTFDLFGGIRSMARAIGEPSSTVYSWKREGRIPAQKQPHVLQVGLALGLPITCDKIVFPLGRPSDVAPSLKAEPAPVVCDQHNKTQRTGAGQ